ncbi:hypothetical protein BTH42_13190 [Burkholderia sp. SRS-W-2-2016]|uniref:FmdB family zinc ribbon protein n=1 Tax=Burkholderia sp. SRS-W-2-2016 TaxID=1926878 RepID=UPI00094B2483|nr:zinc ribbon domain-containing protein [Burkholderia sp. SRS-W-2-2016]OLL31160.1 hypothetical protein BTH42_13190 [Burkholderia sp. SRS-W-2-2016]
MPIYDYECPSCGLFEARRMIAERDSELCCPACGRQASRHVNTKAASLAGVSSTSDEGAGSYGMRHAGGCLCCR